jgi:hypothetical protein
MKPALDGMMHRRAKRAQPGRALVVALALAAVWACSSNSPDQAGVWGSDQATLTMADTGATLRILASGGCYGSYGEFGRRLPAGAFSIAGTYTQLIGAYPGKVQYPAQFAGTFSGARISLSVTVPDLQQTFGPYQLAQGVTQQWPACAYP